MRNTAVACSLLLLALSCAQGKEETDASAAPDETALCAALEQEPCDCGEGEPQGTRTCNADGTGWGECEGCQEEPPGPCDGIDCLGHGQCIVLEGQPKCKCDPGYLSKGLGCYSKDCQPDCTNRFCGPDNCGSTCGTCAPDQTCTQDGQCEGGRCLPDCTGKFCGPDGCGDLCGTCPPGKECQEGICVQSGCEPQCNGKFCGPDGCGSTCGQCPEGKKCNNGICIPDDCQPDCAGKACGDDGCAGSCGTCEVGKTCKVGLCVIDGCVPQCAGKECGDDTCGGWCGNCKADEECIGGQCQPAGGGCVGYCGEFSPEGCACDELCMDWGDCCPNFCAACPGWPGCGGGECGPEEMADCWGSCALIWSVGDGWCDENLNCAQFDFDGGDCGGGCGPEEMADCWGGCALIWSVGDGWCDENLNCAQFDFDGGDCGGGGDSCQGACGGSAWSCFCDDLCFDYGECCPDVCEACPMLYFCGGGCGPEETPDCWGGCAFIWSVGDGWCDENLNCAQFDFDGGDCACTPDCEGKMCGDDFCGGSCGECPPDWFCNDDFMCQPGGCVPDCVGKGCGEDGCGGSCGVCAEGEACLDNQCVGVVIDGGEADVIVTPDVVTPADDVVSGPEAVSAADAFLPPPKPW